MRHAPSTVAQARFARHDVLAIGVAHDVAVQPAGLNEIVVFGVLLIRLAPELAGVYQPAEIGAALRVSLGTAVTVGGIDGLSPGVVIGHRRILVVGATVENRANTGVRLPTPPRKLAFVNCVRSSVTSKKPCAPLPLACTTRSGTRSRLKCCIFLHDIVVVQRDRAGRADSQRILVPGRRDPGVGGSRRRLAVAVASRWIDITHDLISIPRG